MSLKTLDFIFPFIVFFYGLILLVMLETRFFQQLGHSRLHQAYQQLVVHRPLAWVCFFIGGLWSLQNLFI